jgi:hypothetical protein
MKAIQNQREYERACMRQIALEERADMEERPMTSKELAEYRQLSDAVAEYEEDVMRGAGNVAVAR